MRHPPQRIPPRLAHPPQRRRLALPARRLGQVRSWSRARATNTSTVRARSSPAWASVSSRSSHVPNSTGQSMSTIRLCHASHMSCKSYGDWVSSTLSGLLVLPERPPGAKQEPGGARRVRSAITASCHAKVPEANLHSICRRRVTALGRWSSFEAQIEGQGDALSRPAAIGASFHVVAGQAMTRRGLAAGAARWSGREPVLDFVDWAEFERRVGPEHAETTRRLVSRR
jgi:hypothetical protein